MVIINVSSPVQSHICIEECGPLFLKYRVHGRAEKNYIYILKIKDHILPCRYDFVHDWIHLRLPQTFNNIFDKKPPPCYNIRRNHSKVTLPSRRLENWGTNSLRYQGSIIHNSLVDLGLHNIKSKHIVKNKIKSMFLSSYVWGGTVPIACLSISNFIF